MAALGIILGHCRASPAPAPSACKSEHMVSSSPHEGSYMTSIGGWPHTDWRAEPGPGACAGFQPAGLGACGQTGTHLLELGLTGAAHNPCGAAIRPGGRLKGAFLLADRADTPERPSESITRSSIELGCRTRGHRRHAATGVAPQAGHVSVAESRRSHMNGHRLGRPCEVHLVQGPPRLRWSQRREGALAEAPAHPPTLVVCVPQPPSRGKEPWPWQIENTPRGPVALGAGQWA
jgi:hypothetical protein